MSDPAPALIQVCPYSLEAVRKIIVSCAGVEHQAVESKSHLVYLDEYLKKIKTKTVVFEPSYTDRDFLEDYAEYYVRCFDKYRSRCSRLHFFSSAFDEAELRKAVLHESATLNEESLRKSYLGFIVIKPLPRKFIGRTCLLTYPERDNRHYPVTREYDAHLLGFCLTVKSLAFQEQDSIAAACATSALWSAFQGTGKLFQHAIPSPIEITKSAIDASPQLARTLPNKGLNAVQMAAGVKRIGLESEIIGAGDEATLKATAYAYLRARIPVLMIASLFDCSDPAKPQNYGGPHASHAVTVTGYRLDPNKEQAHPTSGTLFVSSALTQLYVHDDQVGPFARLVFTGKTATVPVMGMKPGEISYAATHWPLMESNWPGPNGKAGAVFFVPTTLIVPLYHKIRIPFDLIWQFVLRQDAALETKRQAEPTVLKNRLRWDVFLTNSGDLKRDLQLKAALPADLRWGIVLTSMPKFVWRAIAYDGAEEVLEFVFDATDIEHGNFLMGTISYKKEVADKLLA